MTALRVTSQNDGRKPVPSPLRAISLARLNFALLRSVEFVVGVTSPGGVINPVKTGEVGGVMFQITRNELPELGACERIALSPGGDGSAVAS
jgi:hypothetical protein